MVLTSDPGSFSLEPLFQRHTGAGSLFTDLPNHRENWDAKCHFEGKSLYQVMLTGRLSSLYYPQSYKRLVNETGAC